MQRVDIDQDLKMQLKKNHLGARKYRYSLRPDSGLEYSPGDTIRFQIPTRRKNTFLVNENCFLKFKTTVTAMPAGTCRFDGSASSVIQRVEEFSSGNLLSSLDQYNSLFDIHLHSKMSQSAERAYDIFMGTNSDNRDEIGIGASIANNGSYVACLPLMTPFVGQLNEQNLPVYALEDVRLEITLASKANAFVITDAATIDYSDVSLELEFLELSDEAMQVAMQSINSDGTMSFHSNAFRAYTSTIATGSSGVQAQLVNAKFASLKTLYSVYLESLGSAEAYGTTSRTKGIQSYQVKVGSMLVPQAPLKDVADMFLATQMANHNGIASMASKGSTTLERYANNPGTTDSTSFKNDFYMAVSLDNIHGSNHLLMSGINSTGENLFVEVDVGTQAVAGSVFCIHYAEHDCVFTIQDGVARVRF